MPIFEPCNCPQINDNPVNVASFDAGGLASNGAKGCYCPLTNCIYWGAQASANVVKFDLNTYAVSLLPISGLGANRVFDIVFSPVNGQLYLGTNTTSVIVYDPDTETQGVTITTTDNASALAYCSSNDSVYCANKTNSNSGIRIISVIDCNTNTDSDFTAFSSGLASSTYGDLIYIEDLDKLYFTGYWGGGGGLSNLYSIAPSTNTVTLRRSDSNIDNQKTVMSYSGTNDFIYITSNFSSTVQYGFTKWNALNDVFAGTIILGTGSGNLPTGTGFNPLNDFLFFTQTDTRDNLMKFMKTSTETIGNSVVLGGNTINGQAVRPVTPENSRLTYCYGGSSDYINVFGTS